MKAFPAKGFFQFQLQGLSGCELHCCHCDTLAAGKKAFSFQSEKNLSTSHVLQATIGLSPVPFLTKDSGNMGSAFVPMIVDSDLNRRNIFFINGPFPDGNGQHVHRISERIRGRQQKMHRPQKKLLLEVFHKK